MGRGRGSRGAHGRVLALAGRDTGTPVSSARAGSVASNTAVQLAGKGVALAIGLVSIAVLTRYLGPDDYGKYTLALMYIQLFGVLADVGLFTTVVREISKRPERTEELVGNALLLRLVLAIAVIALAVGVSLLLPYERRGPRRHPDRGRPASVRDGEHDVRGGPPVAPAHGARGGRRRGGRAVSLALVLLVAGLDLGFYAVLGTAAAGGARHGGRVTWRLTRRSCACARSATARLAARCWSRRPARPGAGDQRASTSAPTR